MAKTLLTQKIESALKVWHPTNYGRYRVDSFRPGFDALEVPVECGSIKSGLIDFVRVQECFISETKCGTCKLSMYKDEDKDLVMPSIRQWTQEVSCPKDISNWSFRNEPCTERWHKIGIYRFSYTHTRRLDRHSDIQLFHVVMLVKHNEKEKKDHENQKSGCWTSCSCHGCLNGADSSMGRRADGFCGNE